MKKLVFIFIISIFVISCSNKQDWVINESTQIIEDYADTLEWSIQNSKEVKNLIENNQKKLIQDIKSVK